MSPTTEPRLERGVTLVELIVFIVIVSTAVAGVLMTLDISNRSSADPMIQKQALAIAEALLEEVRLQAFTYCDPNDDAAVTNANSAADCTGGAGGANDETKTPLVSETGEARASTTSPFDNVSDYNTFCMGPACAPPSTITDLNGTSMAGLEAYTANVIVANPQPSEVIGSIPAPDSLFITVTVTGPANTTVVLHGYRVRYAPNAPP
jgi:MSHA pilin protein MshD